MKRKDLSELSIIFIGFIAFIYVLDYFQSFLRPFAIALIFTILFNPIAHKNKKKIMNIMISIFIVFFILFVIGVFGSMILTESEQITTVFSQNVANNSFSLMSSISKIQLGSVKLDSYYNVNDIVLFIQNIILFLFNGIVLFFKELFMVSLFLIFLLPFYNSTILKIGKLLTKRSEKKFELVLNEIHENIRSYILTKTFISFLTAFLSIIVLYLFNLKFVLMFGLIIFMFNYIPNIGSIIAVLLIMTYSLIIYGLSWSFIFVSLSLILIQFIVGNYIDPKITGKKLEISPFIIILSLFFWGYIWGVIGMFVAVPLTSIIKITLSKFPSTKKFSEFLS